MMELGRMEWRIMSSDVCWMLFQVIGRRVLFVGMEIVVRVLKIGTFRFNC